ncbi:PQQ-binding-like beta-propeller repeat protein [Actinoplanes sp. NPDC023801]|uniref:outer membrane protein assembly factor BamB family protein n=1 Tax=Actinoplanes sp. NPDC023801 TaxID=3154595 RepID=UPI0033BFB9D5
MTMTVIDLGDVSDPSAGPEGCPGGGRRREADRIRISRLIRAVIAVVAMLALGGSGLPGRPVLNEVWSVPFSEMDTMTVLGDAVFLFRSLPSGRAELTAYDLASGTVRWTRSTGGETPAWLTPLKRTGVLLVPGDEQLIERVMPDGSLVNYSYGGTLTAVDPVTGRQLWKHDGMQAAEEGSGTLLTLERDDTGRLTTLRLIGSRDGSVVWERPPPTGTENVVVQFDGDTPARVVTVTARGEVSLLAYADGTTRATGRLPWQPPSMASGEGSQITTAGGLLMVLTNTETKSEVAAYDPADLHRLWSRTLPPWAYAETCGPLICLGAAGNFTAAVEPATGEQRWDFLGSPYPGLRLGADRLLITSGDSIPSNTVVDLATGRTIGSAASGFLAFQEPDGGLILLRGLYPELTRNAVTRLDPATGRTRTLGAISASSRRFCDGGGRHIICGSADRLVVTAVG